MRTGKIPSRYARSFFEFSVVEGFLEEARADMALVETVLQENKELRNLMDSPVINPRKKERIIEAIFGAHCSKASVAFMALLAKNKREEFLEDIAAHFEVLYRKHKNILTVKLTTASPMSKDIREEIKNLIHKNTGSSVELEEEVNADLIGGFILEFDDKKYNASISRDLDKLRKEFDINLYIREI